MIGSGTNRINNVINRRNHQYQEINDTDKVAVPKQKNYYYQNAYNMINKNNLSGNNSMNKQNNRMNINRNNINNIKNFNIKNNNAIRNMNSFGQNNNINRALLVIRNEFRKKDDKIKKLELKVAELENKINMITKTNNFQSNNTNNNNNSNIINLTQKKIGKNPFYAEQYSDEINSYNKRDNKTPEINFNRGNNPFRNAENNQNVNNNFYTQNKSVNQYKINNNNDNELINDQKYSIKDNNSNTAAKDASIFTGSSNFQRHSKSEVKLYLKEVKSKVDPLVFKEFINNIKLLTNSKDKNRVDKKSVIEKVRILFGEQFKDLFIRFESILGFNAL